MIELYNALKNRFDTTDGFDQELNDQCHNIIHEPDKFSNKTILNKLVSTSAVLQSIKKDSVELKSSEDKIRHVHEAVKFRKRLLNDIALNLDQQEIFRKDILFISSNPREFYQRNRQTAQLLEEEKEYMHISILETKNWAKLKPSFDCTYEMFKNELQFGGYEIIHFSNHGNDNGIVLRKNHQEIDIVSTEEIGKVLAVFEHINDLEFVFLNACFSETMARKLKDKFPDVTFAFYTKAVPMLSAVLIAKEYYQSLANELDAKRFKTAYTEAYNNLMSRGALGEIDYFKIL